MVKLIVSSSIVLVALLGELLLWDIVYALSLLFILLAILKHKIYPIQQEWLWFFSISIGGAIVEIILINFGNGWQYTNPDFLGIPLWIPLFWGLMGITMITLYEAITE